MAGQKSILDLQERIKTFKDNLINGLYVREIIQDGYTTSFIIDTNTDNQLFEQGINSLGVNISDYAPYSPITITIKQSKGQPTNRVTLKDEGDFYSSFYLDVNNEQFEIKATDEKTDALIKKYGKDILGLTDDNLKILIWEYIYPELLSKAKEVIL